ncbi:MAG TPA: CPBP family intramembrane glutamic endopeptidase [Bryobacteraceae bacterium]
MTSRLRASDYRFIAICLALLAASTWFSVRYFYLAFPEASIDFRVGRAEAQTIAERFLSGYQYRVTGYRTAASFDFDDNAKTFLEREVGLQRANQIMGTRVRLWRWSYRWFRPQQKEEYRVDITPRGELAGFDHQLAEDAPRPAVSDDQARAVAEQFLRDGLQRDPAALDFVEVSTITRPARADRVFTWKERDFDLNGATIRLEVRLLGNETGGYREYLKIPEQWTRDYERLRSKNEVAQFIDTVVVLALAVGMVIVIVLRIRRHDIRWRRAAWVGVVGMVLSACASANQFPLQEFNYPTTDSYFSFVARQALQALLTALGAGGLLFLLTAAAEPLYREFFPNKLSLGHLFRLRGVRTKSFLLGSILGLSLCGIFIAYQTAFYIVAYRFGAWSPADVPYTDLLNTRFPWAYVLFGGFLPAVSEEFLFRMFAIPFLRKLLRFLPAAVALAGFIWGFGHAGYPQQPFYIRGVEVGIGGVVLGLIMLRWGILPTLVWHYSVDAMYTAMLLLRSSSVYFRLSGAASAGIMVLPVLFALVAYWRRGGFEPEARLTNAEDPTVAEEPPAPEPRPAAGAILYRPLTARLRVFALGVCVLGFLTLLIPVPRFGDSPNFRIDATQAASAAGGFARTQAIAPDTFRRVTYPDVHWGGDDSLAGKYFLEHGNVAQASSLFEGNRPLRHWVTRYFRSLDREELLVSVHPETAKVLGFVHAIPEEQPGADVSSDVALGAAGRFAQVQGINLGAMDLKESTSEKKKARRDYRLVWEARPGDSRNIQDAHYRVEIGVAGDQVASWRSYWKLPETFARARSQQNFLSIALLTLRLATIASAFVFGVWSLIGTIRAGLIRWGTVTRIAAPATLLTAVGPLLALPLLLKDYNTAIPLSTYEAVAYVTVAVSVVLGFVVLAAAVAFIASSYPEVPTALTAPNRRTLGLDAVITVLAAAGLAFALSQAEDWLMSHFARQALYSIGVSNLVASAAPAVAAAAGAVRTVLLSAAALTLLALAVSRVGNRWLLLLLGLVALTVNLPSSVRTPGEFALSYGVALLWGGGALLFCFVFARANYLAYALALWILVLRPAAAELLAAGNGRLQAHGFAVIALMLAGAVWALWPRLLERPATASP